MDKASEEPLLTSAVLITLSPPIKSGDSIDGSRILFRLSGSVYRDRLVLKGGMLLAVLGSRRPTGDVDLLARAIDNDVAAIADVVRTVLSVTVDDGVTYEVDDMTTQVIRDAALYSGVRLSVPSRIERAKVVLRLDVNVGDPVTPHPVDVEYPALLDRPFHLLGIRWPLFWRKRSSR